jgi:hypothetical protein
MNTAGRAVSPYGELPVFRFLKFASFIFHEILIILIGPSGIRQSSST